MTRTAPFGDVLEPANAARLLGRLPRVAAVSARSSAWRSCRARCGELLEVRWPDLRWPGAAGEIGMLIIASRNGGYDGSI